MPTREVLTPAQRADFLIIPDDIPAREIERNYTFAHEELKRIREKRRPHNRLGFVVQWAYLRFPGRSWESEELPPEPVLIHIAEQVGVAPTELSSYAKGRDTTRREHLREAIEAGGFQSYDGNSQRELIAWLLPTALSTDSGIKLVEALVREMQSRRIVLPALSTLERLAWEVRHKAQNQVIHALTKDLTSEQKARLDALLHIEGNAEQPQIPLTWVRQVTGRTAPVTILRFLERITFLRSIGLPTELGRIIHQNRLLSLSREGGDARNELWSYRPGQRLVYPRRDLLTRPGRTG